MSICRVQFESGYCPVTCITKHGQHKQPPDAVLGSIIFVPVRLCVLPTSRIPIGSFGLPTLFCYLLRWSAYKAHCSTPHLDPFTLRWAGESGDQRLQRWSCSYNSPIQKSSQGFVPDTFIYPGRTSVFERLLFSHNPTMLISAALFLSLLLSFTVAQLTAADIQTFLRVHNTVRSQHGAAALTWSTTLAGLAQQWAANCEMVHSRGRLGNYGG